MIIDTDQIEQTAGLISCIYSAVKITTILYDHVYTTTRAKPKEE